MEIKPKAMAMPRDTSTLPQGKYGPVFPKSPACHGFTIIAKIIPGHEPVFYEYAQNIERFKRGEITHMVIVNSMKGGFSAPKKTLASLFSKGA